MDMGSDSPISRSLDAGGPSVSPILVNAGFGRAKARPYELLVITKTFIKKSSLPTRTAAIQRQPRRASTDLDSVIRPAIPRINLRHAGPVNTLQRRIQRGKVAAMVQGRHGLRVGGAPDPALAYPVALKGRVDLSQRGQEALHQFVFAQLKVFVLGRHVVAAIHDMVAAVMLARDIVGVFHQRQKGKVRLRFVGSCRRQIKPVGIVRHQRLFEREDDAEPADALQRGHLPAIFALTQVGRHPQQQPRRCRAEHAVEALPLAADTQCRHSLTQADLLDGRAQMNRRAARSQLRRQLIQESLKAAGVGTQLERALDDARPHE